MEEEGKNISHDGGKKSISKHRHMSLARRLEDR
jgi:hypothetical protein